MDKQPVGQLPDLTQSNNDDEIMVITNDEYNQLKKEKISDFITDLTSTDENNAIVKGTDGKLFTKDFGNASNITEGTLPVSVLPDIPKDKLPDIEITDLPESGVTADTYAYPSSVTVNAQGQVTAIEEGTPSGVNADTDLSNLTPVGEKHFLNKSQITNCILEAPNGLASYSGSVLTLKSGIKYLTGIGRNSDLSLKNAEYTTESEKTLTFSPVQDGFAYVYILNGYPNFCPVSECYFIDQDPTVEAPTGKSDSNQVWFDLWNNEIYHSSYGSTEWVKVTNFAVVGKAYFSSATSSTITAFRAKLPVELLQRENKAEISGWGMPSDKYIGLTLGASGQEYTAPADGWFRLIKKATAVGQDIGLYRGKNHSDGWTSQYASKANQVLTITLPILKGQKTFCYYDAGGETVVFEFIYAEGAK